jgi:hypothetical protein
MLASKRVCRQAALFVIAGRFTNQLFIRDCTCVAPGIDWRNRAFEDGGWAIAPGRKCALRHHMPDSARAPVSGICRRPLWGRSVIVWHLRACRQRER